MLFLKIDGGERKLVTDPNWIEPSTGEPCTPAELVAKGYGLPVVDTPPEYDPSVQRLEVAPLAEWALDETTAIKGYTIVDLVFTESDVNAERERRIAAGATFTVAGYGDIPMTGRPVDQTNLLARLMKASAYEAAGVTDPVLVFRDADNVNHMLTPLQMRELVNLGTQWVEDTMAVSWAMKDGDAPFEAGVPANFRSDVHWP